MKIKRNNNIIGVFCTNEESEIAFNTLVDIGVDPYLIHSESKNGKTAHCFMLSNLPSMDGVEFAREFDRVYAENLHPTASLLHDIRDYFDVAAASIGGVHLTQFA